MGWAGGGDERGRGKRRWGKAAGVSHLSPLHHLAHVCPRDSVSCSSHLYLPSPRPGGSQPCLSFLVPESSNGTDARPRPRDSEGVVPGVESGFSTFYLLPGGPLI